MTDYTELKRLAEAAQYENCEFQHELVAATKAFFVGCIPEQILALIAENERLSADCSSMRGSLKANAASIKKLIKDGGRAARERDQYRAEVAGLKTGYEAYERVNAELKAEVERLRKDADRWQFVRNPVGSGSPFAIWSERTNLFLGKFADEAIDAAMGKGEQS
ncbi:hypothetical protein [Pseudomonas sp. 'CRE Jenny 4']|uniref:hypothetical protein n=1 Tax=Pseudomonas sp. 'CRE Jenny 4' TaxID=3045817 RepID=UPI0025A175DF|nr:hypothetical protein [Pseudomonas sp. 'CRE Jenny 4']